MRESVVDTDQRGPMPELPPPAEPGTRYTAVLDTSAGEITLELWPDLAPQTVGNFVGLARQGFYDGLEIYRDYGAISAVQAGSGTDAVGWDVGYTLPDELDVAEREGYPIGSVTTAGLGSLKYFGPASVM